MISNKLNFIVGAAIFASTVYLLWIKITRKSNLNSKDNFVPDKNIKSHTNDMLYLETKEKHTNKNYSVKDEYFTEKKLRNEHESDEITSKILNKRNYIIPNEGTDSDESDGNLSNHPNSQANPSHLKKLDDINEESLCKNFKIMNINSIDCSSLLIVENSLDEFISKGSLVKEQICYSEIISCKNIHTIDGKDNNLTEEFLAESDFDNEMVDNIDESIHIETKINSKKMTNATVEISLSEDIENIQIVRQSEINLLEAKNTYQNKPSYAIKNTNMKYEEINRLIASDGIILESINKTSGFSDEIVQNSFSKDIENIVVKEFEEMETKTFRINELSYLISNTTNEIDEIEKEDQLKFSLSKTKSLQVNSKSEDLSRLIYTNTTIDRDNFDNSSETIKNIPKEVENSENCVSETKHFFVNEFDNENKYVYDQSKNSLQKNIEQVNHFDKIDNIPLINHVDASTNFEILNNDLNKMISEISETIDINYNSVSNYTISQERGFIEDIQIDENTHEHIKQLTPSKIEREIVIEPKVTEKHSDIEQCNVNQNDKSNLVYFKQIENNTYVYQCENLKNIAVNNIFRENAKNFDNIVVTQDVDASSDISQNSDYIDDSPLTNFMEYIEECLNGNESKHDNIESNSKMENWPNDEDSLNNIKRDFYEINSMICSPHPSSESDHAHCVNNLTERVAILSAESILDNHCHISSSDSEMTPTLNSPIYDSNPELYVEKITCDGKELDVVYFEEALLEEGGVHPDVKIIRTIPVGLGGRIIGKKGKTKNELMKKYGAQLLIYNHPVENGKQVLEITCSPSVRSQLENWINKTLDQITKNTLQTTVSNPEWLKPMIPLGKLVAAHIVDMPTIQHIKLRIFDPEIIKAFNKMQNEMNIDYSKVDNTALLPRPVAVGCVCIAMVRPNYFLRAQIIEIYEDIVWVYLFDLGKVCQTYLYYLFKIREKYMRVPFQVIPARMSHASIKNKNITPEIIYKRFLCNQSTMKPKMVRIFFPRMNTCCEPCVNIYIPMSFVTANDNNEEFVDLLELLVSIEVCSMIKIDVNSEIQMQINTSHVEAFLNEKVHNSLAKSTIPVYFQPSNSKFYEDFIEFKSERENS